MRSSLPDALVLCGGAGLRLRTVTGDAPKSMARVAGRPFLELLLRQLRRHGFSRVIMAVGYQREAIRSHFGADAFGLRLIYSEEMAPLGTGGALRNAVHLLESDVVLVMNGDSYTDMDLGRFVAEHMAKKAEVSVAIVPSDGRTDCGSVFADESGRLTAFAEKQDNVRAPYINAGIYLLSKSLLLDIAPGLQVSLERELLPRWLAEGRTIRTYAAGSGCVDIGTPERLREAQEILAAAERNAAEL
jgi:NDP-sugar pyrophosphorylase family protein